MLGLDVNLHDYEVGNIKLEYKGKKAQLTLKSPQPQSICCELRLFGLTYLQMELDEPWGPGFYVSYLKTSLQASGRRVELCLNSGDRLIAECSDVEFVQGHLGVEIS